MSTHNASCLSAVLAATLLAGCIAPPTLTAPPSLPATPGTVETRPPQTTHIIDKNIVKKIEVQAIHVRRLANGEAEIITRVINKTDYPQQVEARTHFITATGGEAEPPAAWSRLYLAPQSTASYKTNTTAGAAVQFFRVELRGGQQ